MPSPPAPEKPTWRRRRTRRRNLNRDAVRAPLRPRRASREAARGPVRRPRRGGLCCCCWTLPACQRGSATRPAAGAAAPPPGPAAPAAAFRAAAEAAEAPRLRAACTPRAPGSRTALGRGSWGGGGREGRRPAGAETPRGGGEDGDLTSQWQTDRRLVDRTNSNRWFLRLLTYQSVLQRMDFFF